MQHSAAFPLHALVCFLVAVPCSALIRQSPGDDVPVSYSTMASTNVEYAKALTGCTRGMLADDWGTCAEKSLLLDIYAPNGTNKTTRGDRRPAILIVHGGANEKGRKESFDVMASANFFAEHGYVAFVPDYRIAADQGTYPGEDFVVGLSPWSTLYPAVRDVKASLRYIIVNADTLGVDTSRIAAMGTSAGAMDILAAFGVNDNSQFTSELSLDQDPTLSTVNAEVKASVQAIIMKWGASWGVESYYIYSNASAPWEKGGEADDLCPVMIFHGTADELIPFEYAVETSQRWDVAGAQNCFQPIPDGDHTFKSWAFGCTEQQQKKKKHTFAYCDVADQMSLSFLHSVETSAKGRVKCPAVPAATEANATEND